MITEKRYLCERHLWEKSPKPSRANLWVSEGFRDIFRSARGLETARVSEKGGDIFGSVRGSETSLGQRGVQRHLLASEEFRDIFWVSKGFRDIFLASEEFRDIFWASKGFRDILLAQ